VAQLPLVRPVHVEFYMFRLLSAVVFVATNLYLLAVWCFVLMRTGLTAAWVLAASNALALVVAVINLVLAFDFRGVERFLGPDVYYLVYWAFLAMQPFDALVTVVGITLLVRHILGSQPPPAVSTNV
jgi:hypothetical protein